MLSRRVISFSPRKDGRRVQHGRTLAVALNAAAIALIRAGSPCRVERPAQLWRPPAFRRSESCGNRAEQARPEGGRECPKQAWLSRKSATTAVRCRFVQPRRRRSH
jgi:hypothetical protein